MFSQTLGYIFKAGNQLWLCLPAVSLLVTYPMPRMRGVLGSLQQWLLVMLVWLPPLCKAIDNAARIYADKDIYPVPFGLSGEFRLSELAQYLAGISIITLPFVFLPAKFYAPLFFVLLPAIHESFLESRTLMAMLSPAALLAACARIGFARYCYILLSYLILCFALLGLGTLLKDPAANGFFILASALDSDPGAIMFLFIFVIFITLVLYLVGLAWMFATLYPTMLCHDWWHLSEKDDESGQHGDD